MCVPPAIHTAVSQRAPGAALAPRPAQRAAAEAAAEAAAAAAGTHYRAAFTVDPSHDYGVDPRVRRGAAAAPATASMGLSEQPRLPPTTYQAELLGRRDGGGCDGAGAAGASQPGVSASAPTSPAMPRPGWLTTAQAAQLPLAELAAAAASRSAGSSPTAAAAAQPACAPREQSASACRAALASGAGARECLTEGPLLSRASPPRRGAQPPPPKDAVLMQALDQHSRGRVPGCTTYKPRGGAQVALEPAPPSRATTWGAASQQALRWWAGLELELLGAGWMEGPSMCARPQSAGCFTSSFPKPPPGPPPPSAAVQPGGARRRLARHRQPQGPAVLLLGLRQRGRRRRRRLCVRERAGGGRAVRGRYSQGWALAAGWRDGLFPPNCLAPSTIHAHVPPAGSTRRCGRWRGA